MPDASCSYIDLAGLCLMNVTDEGRLSWSEHQAAIPTHKQLGGTCLELAAQVATDARAAAKKSPELRFYWGMSGPMATMVRVYNSTSLREALLSDLANFTRMFDDVVHGFAFDYEVESYAHHAQLDFRACF